MTATITPDATTDATGGPPSLDEARWRAMADRPPGSLDSFVIAVRTTGIARTSGSSTHPPRRATPGSVPASVASRTRAISRPGARESNSSKPGSS